MTKRKVEEYLIYVVSYMIKWRYFLPPLSTFSLYQAAAANRIESNRVDIPASLPSLRLRKERETNTKRFEKKPSESRVT